MSPRNPSLASDYLMDRYTVSQAKKDSRNMFERENKGLFSDMLSFTYFSLQ